LVTAGPLCETETKPGQREACDRGLNPLAEQLAPPDLVVFDHDWEVFVVHQILRGSSVPPTAPDTRFKIQDARSTHPTQERLME
jgi:hypothetical protein